MKYIYSKLIMLAVVWFFIFLNCSSITEVDELIHTGQLLQAKNAVEDQAHQQREKEQYWKEHNVEDNDISIKRDNQFKKTLPPLYEKKH